MNNQHLKYMAEGINNIPDDHQITTTGKEFKEMMIGFLKFSDSLLDNQKWMYEFLYELRKKEEPNPFFGEGEIEVMPK